MHFHPQTSSRRPTARSSLTAAASALLLAALAACQPVPVAEAQAAPAQALPSVPVAVAVQSTVDQGLTVIARVEPSQRVEIRPRVAGHVEAVWFREGDRVEAGQPLLRIDPRSFDAAVARAKAEVRLAQARETQARSEAQRARALAAEAAIATEEAERRVAAHAEAAARLAAAEATLQSAALEREFALVRSPISGRIGRALVTAGNYVSAGAAQTPLATVVATSPLHVHFDVADAAVVGSIAADRNLARWKAHVLDIHGERELARAPLDFADNEIVSGTGTLRLRARVHAPDTRLMPGAFVRVRLTDGAARPALLVPDKAIGTDQGRRFVLVVGAEGEVAYRAVKTGAQHGELRAIQDGLKAGEQVIVSGLMRVRPGMKVQAVPQDPAGEAAAPSASRSGAAQPANS